MQDTETGKSFTSDIRTSSGMFFNRGEDEFIAGVGQPYHLVIVTSCPRNAH